MNLLLHGIGQASGNEKIDARDALATVPPRGASLVLANPPFGRTSESTSVDEAGRATRDDDSYPRPDFWKVTSNKQLNFVQHIYTPEVMAQEIVEDLQAALAEFQAVADRLAEAKTAREAPAGDCGIP